MIEDRLAMLPVLRSLHLGFIPQRPSEEEQGLRQEDLLDMFPVLFGPLRGPRNLSRYLDLSHH